MLHIVQKEILLSWQEKKIKIIVYLCNTIKYSIVIYSLKGTFISKHKHSFSSSFIIDTLIEIIACMTLSLNSGTPRGG